MSRTACFVSLFIAMACTIIILINLNTELREVTDELREVIDELERSIERDRRMSCAMQRLGIEQDMCDPRSIIYSDSETVRNNIWFTSTEDDISSLDDALDHN